jgi:hypothetical protein
MSLNEALSTRGFRLIIFGQKHGCRAPVGLGDNPELHTASVVIDGKEPATIGKRPLICRAVFGADIAPIAMRVIGKRRANLVIAERPHGIRGHHHLAERKPPASGSSEYRIFHRCAE